jgi:hypothetical protein
MPHITFANSLEEFIKRLSELWLACSLDCETPHDDVSYLPPHAAASSQLVHCKSYWRVIWRSRSRGRGRGRKRPRQVVKIDGHCCPTTRRPPLRVCEDTGFSLAVSSGRVILLICRIFCTTTCILQVLILGTQGCVEYDDSNPNCPNAARMHETFAPGT